MKITVFFIQLFILAVGSYRMQTGESLNSWLAALQATKGHIAHIVFLSK